MEKYKLGEMEQRFADMLWNHAPIGSGQLVKLCEKEFNWKRTTTYTMLKRLCERGIFVNEGSIVKVLMNKEEFQGGKGEEFINDNFEGSLPRFLVAFCKKKKLTDNDINELKKLIDSYKEENND